MPEQKRPRGSSSRSTGGRPRGSSSRTSKPTKRSPSRKPPASSRRAAPARRDDDDLQPLDLEGTDFEELLGAGEPRGQDDLDDVDLDEDDDEDLDEDDEDGDGFADLRAPRTGGAASSEPSDLAARFGTYASSGEPVQPWTPEQPAADVEVDVDADGKRSDELIVGSLGLALVILTAAMPWYEIGVRQMTGLAAGSFGILPLVAGIGTIVTVVLKLAGKQLRFPVERGMMLEILGYLAVGGTVLARIFRPPGAVLIEPWGYPTLITMAAGIGLAWFASRLSHGAPLVLRPGWIKEAGGRAGAALLVLLVLLGGVLWLAKPFDSTPQARGVGDTLKYTQDPPSCFTENDFPLPPALIIDSKGFFRYDL